MKIWLLSLAAALCAAVSAIAHERNAEFIEADSLQIEPTRAQAPAPSERNVDAAGLRAALDVLENILQRPIGAAATGDNAQRLLHPAAQDGSGGSGDVCCKKGNRHWSTSPRQCRREGGGIVAEDNCASGESSAESQSGNQQGKVCCKMGRREFYASPRECRRSGGNAVEDAICQGAGAGAGTHAADRVCCKKGRREFYTTNRDCRREGGQTVTNRICRGPDTDKAPPTGSAGVTGTVDTPPPASTSATVCCNKGQTNSYMSGRACQKISGNVVADNKCQGGTSSGGQSSGSSGSTSTPNPNATICCNKGANHFFQTRSVCTNSGGKVVADEQRCREAEQDTR